MILNTKVIAESEETNKFIINEQQENFSTLNFDYDDPRETVMKKLQIAEKELARNGGD